MISDLGRQSWRSRRSWKAILRKDRTRHGGGVGIYIREDLNFKRLPDLEIGNSELMWVRVSWPNFCLLFGVCYRPPGQNNADKQAFLFDLELSLNAVSSYKADSIILTGDFNDPCYVWDSAHFTSELGSDLVALTGSANLSQLVRQPTRGHAILDLIFTNTPDLFKSISVLDPIHDLDHLPVSGRVVNESYYKKQNFS